MEILCHLVVHQSTMKFFILFATITTSMNFYVLMGNLIGLLSTSHKLQKSIIVYMCLPNNDFAFVYRLVLARTTPHTPNIIASRETMFKKKSILSHKHPCNHQANGSVCWGQQHGLGKFS
jgi:hypothetical protein